MNYSFQIIAGTHNKLKATLAIARNIVLYHRSTTKSIINKWQAFCSITIAFRSGQFFIQHFHTRPVLNQKCVALILFRRNICVILKHSKCQKTSKAFETKIRIENLQQVIYGEMNFFQIHFFSAMWKNVIYEIFARCKSDYKMLRTFSILII